MFCDPLHSPSLLRLANQKNFRAGDRHVGWHPRDKPERANTVCPSHPNKYWFQFVNEKSAIVAMMLFPPNQLSAQLADRDRRETRNDGVSSNKDVDNWCYALELGVKRKDQVPTAASWLTAWVYPHVLNRGGG
jgi:hypothetical protein